LSSILKGGELPAGTSFAALNLGTLIATGALKPAKELAEAALADVYSHFMYWANHTQNSIEGLGMGKNKGKQYTIEWDEFDPENLYINCELKPDVALDRQQRANVAMGLIQAGLMSKEQAIEYMGENDPQAILDQIDIERLWDNRIQIMIQREQMQVQMEAQQIAMQQQQAADEAAMAQQEQAMAAQQGQMAGAPGGQMFNAAAGGLPAQMGAPGATREGVTGQDMMGNEQFMGIGGL